MPQDLSKHGTLYSIANPLELMVQIRLWVWMPQHATPLIPNCSIPLFHFLVRGCVVQAHAYALSLNYAGCLTSSVVLSFFLYGFIQQSIVEGSSTTLAKHLLDA